MKILITGADGFIGSHLTDYCLKNGHTVRALAQYNSFNSTGWLNKTHNNLEIVLGDIRDSNFIDQLLKNIDIVFNLAALISIPYSYKSPESYIDTNIKGTLNLCNAALKNKIKKFIQISTSEVYGSALYIPINELHPLQPQSPYSASKIGSDSLALSFYYSFNLPLTIARPFNTYGPRQSMRAVIPTIINQILLKNKFIEIGDTSTTRDFNFVLDTVMGIYKLGMNKRGNGEIFNIGSSLEYSIDETISIIKKFMNSDIKIKINQNRLRPKKSEVTRLLCDNSKIKKFINYKPNYSFERGLKKTIDWYKKDNSSVNNYSLNYVI